MKIPDDIYYRVLDLATALVNASESFDKPAQRESYAQLREFVESEVAAGRPHAFLFETLADFSDDDRVALDLYEKALEQTIGQDAGAYRASVQFAMAERYKNLGNASLAYEYASRASEAATSLDDLELRKQISEFLLDASKNA